MKNVILVTLLAGTLGLGVAAQANDTTTTSTPETQMQKEHKDGKHKGQKGNHRGLIGLESFTTVKQVVQGDGRI